MDEIVDVEITAPDAEWLAQFTRGLVTDRLAASGNLTTGLRSIYRWHGAVHDEPEAKVVLHTRRSLVSRIIDRVDGEHPYDVPGLRVTAVGASPGYHRWVLDQTQARRD